MRRPVSETLPVLRGVRSLIEQPDRWTVEAEARDAAGERMAADDLTAVRWSLEGGLLKIAGDEPLADAVWMELFDDCALDLVPELVGEWYGHEAVLDLLDKTIARLEAREETEC